MNRITISVVGVLLALVGCGDVGGPTATSVEDAQAISEGAAGALSIDAPRDFRAEWVELNDALQANPDDAVLLKQRSDLFAASDKAAGLVMRIELGENRAVMFYEPESGAKAISELVPIDEHSVFADYEGEPTTASMYRFLRPDTAVPEELLAFDRRVEIGIDHPAEPDGDDQLAATDDGEPAADEFVQKNVTSSCSHFTGTHQSCPTLNISDPHCWCNSTGNWTENSSNKTQSWHQVWVYSGSQIIFSWGLSGVTPWINPINVGQGYWHLQYSPTSGGSYIRKTHESAVLSGSGDGWHWGGCFDADYTSPDCPTHGF